MGVVSFVSSHICASSSAKIVVFDTGTPPSPGGFVGFDIFNSQSLGERFIPDTTVRFTGLSIHTMSNADPSATKPNITLTLLECAGDQPAVDPRDCVPIETWADRPVLAIIWDPVEQIFLSKQFPTLTAGRSYWITASSNALAIENPLWAMTMAREHTCLKQPSPVELGWQDGAVTQAASAKVTGIPLNSEGRASASVVN